MSDGRAAASPWDGVTPGGLRRLLERKPVSRPGERCEMCGEPIPDEHAHVVQVDTRGLMCTCRACYLLFTRPGAGGGRYLAVPDRVLRDDDLAVAPADWEALEIPVRMAFFFHNSMQERIVGFYPSPGGATECELPLDAWESVLGGSALAAQLTPDVEALLVRRGEDAVTCYLVPIDVCYELVGLVRLHWRGFHGGHEVWAEIDRFFERIHERSRPLAAAGEVPCRR